MNPRICHVCRKVLTKYEAYSERVEMRRVSDEARYRVVTLRTLCKPCCDKAVENYRPIHDVPVQTSLI